MRTLNRSIQVDDELYHVVSSLSQLLVDFVELPMGATPDEVLAYNTCLHKMQVLVNYWHAQDLGIVVAVPGLGRLTLNLAALMSVILASGGAMWVFSKQVRL